MSDSSSFSFERALLGLLSTLPSEWTPSERDEVRQFIGVGEWGLAIETIAGIAMEEGREVTPRFLDSLGA